MTAPRLALLHFSGPPCPGGIEHLLAAQANALTAAGYEVHVVVGVGEAISGVCLHVVPEIDPRHPVVVAQRAEHPGTLPDADHPFTQRLLEALTSVLSRCDQCWVHNALTVTLNPFLTRAIHILMSEVSGPAWVAWCEDITAISRFQVEPGAGLLDELTTGLRPATCVTISEARRTELASTLGVPRQSITIIRPPLEIDAWLSLGEEARLIRRSCELDDADPVVLVPAKLLSHKGLGRAVSVTHALRRRGGHPLVMLTGAASPHEPAASAEIVRDLEMQASTLGVADRFVVLSRLLGRDPSWRAVRDLMLISDVVFVPSEEEGFGVPLLEAAALRVPVVCSDLPVLRETSGDAARYFPLDATDDEVVQLLLAAAGTPTGRLRRAAVRSQRVFTEDVLRLADRINENCRRR